MKSFIVALTITSLFVFATSTLASPTSTDPISNISIDDSNRNAKLAYLVRRYQADPSEENKQAVEEELTSMHRLDSIFGGMTQELGLNVEAGVQRIDFDCYKKRMEIYQNICGRLTDYGLHFAKNIQMTCSQNVADTQFENALKKLC